MPEAFRVALIGGTSHAGKSTTAQALAARLGWRCVSTDSLARHPGRPWRTAPDVVPPHVVEHFSTLGAEALLGSVLEHYRANVWPTVEALVAEASGPTGGRLVLEGSALLPDLVASLANPLARAVWLTASDDVIEARICRESGFEVRDAAGRRLIEAFADRSKRYNAAILADVRRLGLPVVELGASATVDDVVDAALVCLRQPASL